MTVDQLLEEIREFRIQRDALITRKAGDYARQHHVLSNFFEVAAITNRKPQEIILMHLATKVSRLSTLLENLAPGEVPNNESLADSINDLTNYSEFLAVINKLGDLNVPTPVLTHRTPANADSPNSIT